MIAQVSIIDIGVVSSCYGALIVFFIWTSRTRVNHKTFDIERENNKTEHENIRDFIKESESRAKANHDELKTDLKDILKNGLDEVKELIKNNGHSNPRIQT